MGRADSHVWGTVEHERKGPSIDVVTATVWAGSCRTAIVASMGTIAVQVIQTVLSAVEGPITVESQPSMWRTLAKALAVVCAWLLAWAWFGLGRATSLMVARNQTTKATIAKWGALVFAVCITVSELTPRGGEASSSRVAVVLVAALFGQLAYVVFAFWSIAHLKLIAGELKQPSIRFNAHITHVLVWATIVMLAVSLVYSAWAVRSVSSEPSISRVRDAATTQALVVALIATIVHCLAWGAYATTLSSLRRAVQPLTYQAQAARASAAADASADAGPEAT